ncbi:response regulator transcription factor [Pleionea sp. CnH1-48]|uniref:response regulator transcription factor n=1 Tax=Pleionea sp. CnH1-48 TaxID=2954494 RepID=UPI002097D515|nr:response regulator [Pleionea sp. CnH1-48]MCO7224849.1 response regulator [Pleionea sp. CnH1-48]
MTNNETWLIVEDDPVFSSLLLRRLTKKGITAVHAEDSFEALQLANKYRPQKVLLDLKLAEESGLALLPELLSLLPEVKVLILTGYASISTAVTAIKMGAYNYLPKPASTEEIIAALSQDDSKQPEFKPLSPEELEWEHLHKVLAENQGNISATARELGMHRRTLQRKLAKKRAPRS